MTWTAETLHAFETADELLLVLSREGRNDISVPVWVVRVGDEVYLRSQDGVTSGWFRRVALEPDQNVELAGIRMPVHFDHLAGHLEREVSEAYLGKYGGPTFPEVLLGAGAVEATVRVSAR
jgi:hypothetical protein